MIRHSLTDRLGRHRGASLVEVLVAAFVIAVAISALLGAYGLYLRLAFGTTHKIQSAFLMEEGQEIVRGFRDAGWSSNIAPLVPERKYYFTFDTVSGRWSLADLNTPVDGIFTREWWVANVARDGANNIVPSGGSNDPHTRAVFVSVSWLEHGVLASSTSMTYLANLYDN